MRDGYSDIKFGAKQSDGKQDENLAIFWLDVCTNYGYTKAKSLILCSPDTNPNPKEIFTDRNFVVEFDTWAK